ncbi:hypothetical protein G7Z17_g1249 [Cylindrodendrum hubeiense]|uniref:Secretory lipase n=1 Tax=Cylindrodendrum hubeiense TaxID=595255 RepID=A0A9P5HJR6_9HYPO|nr:hypothetical protein G7Z17_g1249 [Cylindrodendrum hubeiense]
MTRTFLRVLAYLAISTALYATPSASSQLPPSKDPFYAVPDDIEKFAPGEILRHRQPPDVISAFGSPPSNLQRSHQILYRTNDDEGNATATVVTVLVPNKPDLSKVVSYQVAEDAVTIDCAPSHGFLFGTGNDPLLGSRTLQTQLLLLQGALEEGWVVIVADYEGPKGAFYATKLAGHAVLDGIRAVIQSAQYTGVASNSQVALCGYSAGAAVTQWAAELQSTYAPELKIAGAALGGGCNSISVPVSKVNKERVAGFIPVILLGLAAQYPEVGEVIEKHLKPSAKEDFYRPLHQCLDANIAFFNGRDIIGMFDDWVRFSSEPAIIKVFAQSNQGRQISQIPMFFHAAVQDEAVPIAQMDKMVIDYCAKGGNVLYRRDIATNLRHTSYGIVGTPIAMDWIRGLFNGNLPKPGCSTITGTTSEIDPEFLKIFPKTIADALVASSKKLGGGV